MSSSITSRRAAGAAIRTSVPKQENRFPRRFTPTEIEGMPRITFATGADSGLFLSRERDGARHFSQGISFIRADADDTTWQATSWDETLGCLSGRFRMLVTDIDDVTVEFMVEAGDFFWAPAGYRYTCRAVGVDATLVLTVGPVMPSGWRHTGDDESYSDTLVALRR